MLRSVGMLRPSCLYFALLDWGSLKMGQLDGKVVGPSEVRSILNRSALEVKENAGIDSDGSTRYQN